MDTELKSPRVAWRLLGCCVWGVDNKFTNYNVNNITLFQNKHHPSGNILFTKPRFCF